MSISLSTSVVDRSLRTHEAKSIVLVEKYCARGFQLDIPTNQMPDCVVQSDTAFGRSIAESKSTVRQITLSIKAPT